MVTIRVSINSSRATPVFRSSLLASHSPTALMILPCFLFDPRLFSAFLLSLRAPNFRLITTVRFQSSRGANRTGVLGGQPGSSQKLKNKDHPTAANESHKNWTGQPVRDRTSTRLN